MDISSIAAIAGQEFRVNLRNRWVMTFAAVFAILTLAISYFGMATSAEVGFQSFTRTSASLLNLVLYVVPLGSLVLAAFSFNGDAGTSQLLFSQPITRLEILAGKMMGLSTSVFVAVLFGFGVSGIVIGFQAGSDGIPSYLAFVGFMLLLVLVFLSIGVLIAISTKDRATSIGFAVALWFFFVVFYDLIIIGAAFVLQQHTANTVIFLSVFGNPIDLVRVSSLLVLGSPTIFGAAGSALLKFFHSAPVTIITLVSALLVWVFGPLMISTLILRRRDI